MNCRRKTGILTHTEVARWEVSVRGYFLPQLDSGNRGLHALVRDPALLERLDPEDHQDPEPGLALKAANKRGWLLHGDVFRHSEVPLESPDVSGSSIG